MTAMSDKTKFMHPRLHQIFKVILWIAGIFLILLIAAVVFVRIQYPEHKVLQLISDQVQSSTGLSLEIKDVSWRLPLRLDIFQITLDYPKSDPEADRPLFTLNRFSVSFRLLPLLRRRLHIQSVTLNQPNVYLDPNRWIVPFAGSRTDSATIVKKDTYPSSPKSLPFALQLSRFSLKDFDCMVILPDSQSNRSFQITSLNFNLDNLNVPRNAAASLQDFRGRARLYTEKSSLKYSEDGWETEALPNIDLQGKWRKNQHWQLQGQAGFSASADSSQMLGVQLDVNGIGKADSVHIKTVQLELGGKPMLRILGDLARLSARPEFDVMLESESIDLNRLYVFARAFLPPALMTILESLEIQGNFTPPEGYLRGNSETMIIQVQTSLKNGIASYMGLVMDSLHGHLNIEGRLKTGSHTNQSLKFIEGKIQGSTGIASCSLMLNDSTNIQTGPLILRMISRTDSCGLPDQGSLTGQFNSMLGGRTEFDFQWGLPSGAPKSLESVYVRGLVRADSLELNQFPDWPQAVRGRINCHAHLTMPSLYQAVLNIGAEAPGFDIVFDNQAVPWPALNLDSEWTLHTEPSFQQVWLDSGEIQLNNIMDSWLTSHVDLRKQEFWIELREAIINLELVQSSLPAYLLEDMEELTVGGKTVVSAHARGAVTQPDSMQIQGMVALHEGTLQYGIHGFKFSGLQGQLTTEGHPGDLTGSLSFTLDSADLGVLRSRPIENSVFMLDWQWIADESVSLREAVLRNDSLGIEARIEGSLNNLAAIPALHANGTIRLDEDNWAEAVHEIEMRGKGTIEFKVDQTTHPSRLAISGSVALRPLEMKRGTMLSMSEIRGRVPFQIEFDLEQSAIVTDPDYIPPSWIDYESRRSQYRSLNPDQGGLYAELIQVNQYQFTDLAMDIDVRKGYIQIPWFMVDLFNGNVGGYLQIFLGTGLPETIAYEIHAQAARINAAALGGFPIKKEEEAELDVTMAFKGLGVDIEKDMDIDGYFYMTQIGPQFASRLLQGLDPNGEDRNIRLTRRLLNMGWKPKLFSFDMRHGYVYPSLSLSQPWFSPIRLPETLSYGRLPLKFFLENPDLAQAKAK